MEDQGAQRTGSLQRREHLLPQRHSSVPRPPTAACSTFSRDELLEGKRASSIAFQDVVLAGLCFPKDDHYLKFDLHEAPFEIILLCVVYCVIPRPLLVERLPPSSDTPPLPRPHILRVYPVWTPRVALPRLCF